MTACMPEVAALVFGDHPYYAAKSLIGMPVEAPVMWFESPSLPNDRVRWCRDDEITREHATLTVAAYAELLFLAAAEPSAMSDADALAAIDYVLTTYHCDLRAVAAAVAHEYGESWAGAAAGRMSRCVVVASRLTGVSV